MSQKQVKIPLLVIAGPTAAGKSEAGLLVAQKTGGEIVSADSAQVYRYLDIGTAKPGRKERETVSHHLIDLVDPDEEFNVSSYKKLSEEAIQGIGKKGKLPVLVGGTGLYIHAVVDNYSFSSQGKDEQLRKKLHRAAERKGNNYLHSLLHQVDPESAEKISPADRKRMVRALEVYYSEGRPLSEQNKETPLKETPYLPVHVGLYMPREKLYEKINSRVDNMIEKGFLEEVKELLRWYPPSAWGLQILGYRQMVNYLQGYAGWEETVYEIKKQTRNLAKRQLTWFRRDDRINWIDHESGRTDRVVEKISSLLKENTGKKTNIKI